MSGEAGHRVQMRWRDLDGLGHVNHMVVLTYLEEGRDVFLKQHGIRRDEYVVGRCSVNFRDEIDPAFEAVTVQCAVRELGRSSVTTSERILDHTGQVVVDAEFGLVLWDPAQRVSRPITDEERASPDALGEGPAMTLEQRPGGRHGRGDGSRRIRENNPNIPYTTEEIADSSIQAGAAGATVVHLHVREDDGTPSGRPELFKDVIQRIRGGCDLLTMVSTGGANDMTIEERTTGLEAKPDISGVESGSMNFGDETFITPPPAGRGIIERATEAGIALEVEAFDVGHVASAVRWLEEGILPAPLRINLVFRGTGGHRRFPEALDAMRRPLPGDAFWTVTCIGRHHPRMLALGLLHGARDSHRTRGCRVPAPWSARPLQCGPGRDGGQPRGHARARGGNPGADPGALQLG